MRSAMGNLEVQSSGPSRGWRYSCVLMGAALFVGGCAVRVEERPAYVVHRQPPPREIVVQEPAVVIEAEPEPVAEVIYEPAPQEVVAVYETDLTPHGHWIDNHYGHCWVWNGRAAGWRPYMYGHWVATDDGWLWVSEGEEAEWGATCYHYGRWFEDPAEGWVWVPGSVWAPSWCAWREGGGYSAWAPLPPECGDGHLIGSVVVDRYCRPAQFICVETRNVVNVHIRETVIVNNITIINKTTNITNVSYVNNRVVNRGIDVKHVEKATGHAVHIEKPMKVTSAEEAHRNIAAGHAVIYAPPAVAEYRKAHPIAHREPIHKDPVVHEDHKPVVHDEHKTEIKPEEHKPVVHEEHKTELKPEEHKPIVHEEHKTEVKPEEHKPIVHEEHKTEVKPEEHKPAVHEEHKTEVKPEEHKPVVHEEHKTEVKPEEHKPDPKDPKKDPKKKPEDQK